MCPVKTQNLSRNVPREEGQFWRELVRDMKVKSRANLENFLLLKALQGVNKKAARRLAQIRQEFTRQSLAGIVLLLTLLGGSTAQFIGSHHHGHDLRSRGFTAQVRAKVRHQADEVGIVV